MDDNYSFDKFNLTGIRETHCPCKDCKERNMGCHSKCETYKRWRKVLNEVKKDMKIINDDEIMQIDYILKAVRRNKRGK